MCLLGPLALSCGGPGARVVVRHAEPRPTEGSTLSILGVVKEGRMDQDAWRPLASEVLRDRDLSPCEVGYGKLLHATNPEAFQVVTQEVDAVGMGEEVLEMIAPAALGDFILVFQLYDRLSGKKGSNIEHPLLAHGGGPEPTTSDVPSRVMPERAPAFELSAALFSVRAHHVVVHVSMRYTGPDIAHAVEDFGHKLDAAIPAMACRGWDWTGVAVLRESDEAGLTLPRARLVPR